MSTEWTVLFLAVAFVAFIVSAVLTWGRPRPAPEFFLSIGFASWVFVGLWTAIKAL